MSDVGQLKQTIELYAQKQPDNPLLDVCFALLDMVHSLQCEVTALRADNKALRHELRRLGDAQKTPRERVDELRIEPAFGSIRQQILDAIAAKDQPQANDRSTTQGQIDDHSAANDSLTHPAPANHDRSEQEPHEPASPSGGEKPKPRRGSTGRRKMPEHLPCEVITAMPENLPHGARFIRFDVTHRLGFRTGGLYRVELRRAIFSTPQEDDPSVPSSRGQHDRASCPSQSTSGVLIAPRFEELLPKGLPTPDLLSYVVHAKFGLHLPLNRIEGETERMGFRLARATLSGWLLQLHPQIDRVIDVWRRDGFERAPYVATDATSVKVLAKERCQKSYFWTIIVGGLYVFYRFTEKHNKIAVTELLGDYKGTLLADGATVFNILFHAEDSDNEDMLRAGCWAHCRRYFVKALLTGEYLALQAIGFINMLFAFERDMLNWSADERLKERSRVSQTVIDHLDRWRREHSSRVEGGSELARAFTYLNNQWECLCAFLRDGSIPISNNDSERSLRRLVLGRLNWLFVGCEQGGHAAANYASLIATCHMHGLDPLAYLRDLFRVLPHWPETRYIELAPHRWLATKATLTTPHLSWPLGPLPIPPKA